MNLIDEIKEKAKINIKRIVLPESEDRRVVLASSIASKEGIGNIILIGNEEEVKNNNKDIDLSKVMFIDPNNSKYTDELVNEFYNLRKDKGITIEEAKKALLNDKMYYACMLVKLGYADGIVSGACHSTANTLRPALQIIKGKDNSLVSAFFLMIVPNTQYGEDGVFIFADSGLVQDPTSAELASIAYNSSISFENLVSKKANVALLSHSTFGSARHPLVDKVVEAVKIAKEKYPNINIDGEMQADAAIVPEVAKLKAPDSPVAGKANVLIFPNLDAGNNAYKLVQRLASAEAYGPITQGLNSPVNDLSRGCSVEDIVGVIAITSLQVVIENK